MIDVNLKGTIYAARAAIPHLIATGEGDLVTVASEAGRTRPPRRGGVTAASKFGQVGSHARPRPRAPRSTACAARTSARAGSRLTFAAEVRGTAARPSVLAGMMSAEDVAEVVLFCVTRPRRSPHPRDCLATG